MEVGTLQGGQIAALQDGKEGALGKSWPDYVLKLCVTLMGVHDGVTAKIKSCCHMFSLRLDVRARVNHVG